MNGGEDLWPPQQCLNTSGSNESRVKLQAITGMQSFTADIKYTPPGTKEGKKLLPYKKNNKCVNYQNSNKIICIVSVHHLIIKKNTNMTK